MTTALNVSGLNAGPNSSVSLQNTAQMSGVGNQIPSFSQLTHDSGTLAGTTQFTSDAGLVVWNASIWQPVSGANQFIPSALTTAGIQAAIDAASAAGGGSVVLPPQTIVLTSALVLRQNVQLCGSGWYGTPGSGMATLGGGTVLQGNGTFNGIEYNPTDLAAPYGTAAALANSLIQSASVQNLSLTNFIYGIKVGALFQGGLQNGYFFNLYATLCSAWGMYFENFGNSQFDRLFNTNCGNGAAFIASGTALYNFGNSSMRRVFGVNCTANGGGRGVLVQARGSSSNGTQLNNINFLDMTAGGTVTTSTQAATMLAPAASVITNTSANIAVTNTCVAGEIVQFSVAVGTGGSGVLTGTNYYVLASGLSGSNIQVSATSGGTAITFNASGTPNVNFCKIGITDMTKVGVGMPVHFSGSVNGLQAITHYFVLTVSAASGAGFIHITGAMGGNTASAGQARASTGSSAVNAIFNGWPNFEAGGADATSFITYLSIKGNADIESGNAPRFVLNGVQGGNFELGITHSAGPLNDIVFAQSTGISLNLLQSGLVAQFDSLSQLSTTISGWAPAIGTGVQTGLGIKVQNAGRAQLNLTGNISGGLDDIALMPTTNQLQLNNGLALQHSQQPAATTLTTAMGNLITYTGAIGTLTLPNLTAVTMVGWQFWVANPGASTLTVSATQNIVGLGASGTSVSVLTLQTALFVAQNNAGTMYWAQYK